MFVKLLKYEWRANRSLVGLMCAIIGISGLLIGGILRYMIWSAAMGDNTVLAVYSAILSAAVITILICCALVMYLMVYRFYKSRFGDQGYLMLTLPVTTHQQLFSSILNTAISVTVVGVTALVSMTLAIGVFMNTFDQATQATLWKSFTAVGMVVSERLGITGATMILQIPVLLLSNLADIVLFMLAMTVGAQAHRHPVWKGAAVYILTDMVVSEACGLVSRMTENLLLTAAVSCVLYGVLAVVAYLGMHHIFDKKLNLI